MYVYLALLLSNSSHISLKAVIFLLLVVIFWFFDCYFCNFRKQAFTCWSVHNSYFLLLLCCIYQYIFTLSTCQFLTHVFSFSFLFLFFSCHIVCKGHFHVCLLILICENVLQIYIYLYHFIYIIKYICLYIIAYINILTYKHAYI